MNHIAVKEAVHFHLPDFPGVDTLLGPEMRSTGEVMGLDSRFCHGLCKGSIGGRYGTLPLDQERFLFQSRMMTSLASLPAIRETCTILDSEVDLNGWDTSIS